MSGTREGIALRFTLDDLPSHVPVSKPGALLVQPIVCRDGAFDGVVVGRVIPPSVVGDELSLREFLFAVAAEDTIPPDTLRCTNFPPCERECLYWRLDAQVRTCLEAGMDTLFLGITSGRSKLGDKPATLGISRIIRMLQRLDQTKH